MMFFIEGEMSCCISSTSFPRPLQNPREQLILAVVAPETSTALVSGALFGGREHQRPTFRCRGKVPSATKVPIAAHDLGRRGDELLLQGEVSHCSPRLVLTQSVSVASWEARARWSHWFDHYTSEQLVQESATTRSSCRGQREVRI